MKKIDKNGLVLNIGDTVKYGENIEFIITNFKIRSTGYVVYYNGAAYSTNILTKVTDEEPIQENRKIMPNNPFNFSKLIV